MAVGCEQQKMKTLDCSSLLHTALYRVRQRGEPSTMPFVQHTCMLASTHRHTQTHKNTQRHVRQGNLCFLNPDYRQNRSQLQGTPDKSL